jgi:hypothetical protein
VLYKSVKPIIVDAIFADEPIEVETDDGRIQVNKGEWLVRGVAGELYSCDASSFASTFERMESIKTLDDYSEGKPCGC